MKERYGWTKPVPGGYDFFDVFDSEDEYMPNRALVSIYHTMPGAEGLAQALAALLNHQNK